MIAAALMLLSIVDVYEQRLPEIRAQIPAIVKSANAAAERVLADPETGLVAPAYPGNVEFANELLGRAGGLCKALASPPKQKSAVVLLAVRSWEQEENTVLPKLADYRSKGYLVTVFGSRAGMPTNAVCDFLIDNGASTAGTNAGPVNIMANITLGWMWCCEYAAALSRHGKHPGVLRSVFLRDSVDHNKALQSPEGRAWLGDTDKPVEAGKLSGIYLDRVAKLLRTQSSITNVAGIVADRIRAGKTVCLSGTGHIVNYEMARGDLRSPFRACRPDQIENIVQPGDLLVWIGYLGGVGLNPKGTELLACLKGRGVDVVLCEAPRPSAQNTAADVFAQVAWDKVVHVPEPSPVIATVEQSWGMPDAEVPIPWPPGSMAPVSGLDALLLLRMLDEAVAARLAEK